MLLRRYEYKLPGELNRQLTCQVDPGFHQESKDNLITVVELYGPNYLMGGKMTAQRLSVRYIPVLEVVSYQEALKWCPEGWTPDGNLQVIDGSKRLAVRKFEEVEPDTREVLEIVEVEYV
jgi:hypothetical protein